MSNNTPKDLELVTADPYAIYFMKEPSLPVQLAAIKGNYWVRKFIKIPHPDLDKKYAEWKIIQDKTNKKENDQDESN